MERLTMRDVGDRAFWVSHQSPGGGYRPSADTEDKRRLDRLAAYEDTGLEPEEISGLCSMSERLKMADLLRLEEYQALGPIDHLRKLVLNENAGRLVVHARWLKSKRFKQKRRKCSGCGFDSEFEFNFCPCCGAQMYLTVDDFHA